MGEFWGTLIVAVVVAMVVGFAAFRMVKNKLDGKSSCSCSCSSCPMAGKCHGEDEEQNESGNE